MSFKPMQQSRPTGEYEDTRNMPTPRAGSRKARISLIVDMGVQDREDFEDEKTGELKPQKPCHQVAVYADLVADIVDYGGDIGKAQYRLCLNKSFMGKVVGINFTVGPPKDAKGNIVSGKPWCLHPANALTKLAKVTGNEEIANDDSKNPKSLDISLLLDEPFMAQVEVKKTEDKNGKKDKEGEVIVYTNVNYRGPAEVPEDDDGQPLPVPELTNAARCVTFTNATVEDVKFIRAGMIKQIKLANNYAGSAMEKAILAYEAKNAGSGDDEDGEDEQAKAPAAKPKKAAEPKEAAKPKAKPAKAPVEDDDEDAPF